MLRNTLISALVGIGLSAPAGAWTISQDYDSEAIGAKCGGWGSTMSTVTDEMASSGGKSCKQIIGVGETGFGKWGGIITLPTKLVKGAEFWVRVRTFMPEGFNYDSSGEGSHLKFLRLHIRSDANANEGYDDWYINPTFKAPPAHKFIYEGEQVWALAQDQKTAPVLGVWETYEFYVRLDAASQVSGGMAVVRMWKNGALIGEFKDRKTLASDVSYAERFHVFTYWNGGAPQTQQMYIDDLVLTSDQPEGRDAAGNPYIGNGKVIPRAPSDVVAN